jgi:hypothetical protein
MNRILQVLLVTAAFILVAPSTGRSQDPTVPKISALEFDGASSYVNLTPGVTNFSFGDFTISGWFNIRNKGGAQQFLFRITNQEGNTRRIQVSEMAGTITADIRAAAGGTIYAITTTAFAYDTWIHVAFVREGDQLRLYFDGVEVGSQAAVATAIPANRWAYLGANPYRGGVWGSPDNFFTGMIDEFQIWTIARTAQEIQALMTQPITPATGLRAGWAFNERTGTMAGDSSGNNLHGTVINATWTLPPAFTITDVHPANGAIFVPAQNGIQFNLYPGVNGVDASKVKLTLNGQDVSDKLQITGSAQWLVVFDGLKTNRFYHAQIEVTDRSGMAASQNMLFDTFDPANFSFEAEDFNYNAGQFIDNPPIDWTVQPNYFDQIGVQEIDVLATTSVQPKLYRYAEVVGTALSTDVPREKYLSSGFDDYNVTGITVGSWFNYTRTIPAASYNVYARLARNGAISARLDRVTSDPTQPGQTTEPLGWFKSAGTGSAQVYDWIPLRDAAGNFIAIDLDGVSTLRLSAETAFNANFFLLVPVTIAPPKVANINPTPGSNMTNISEGLTFTVSSGAGVEASAIRFIINGSDQSDSLVISGNKFAWTVSYNSLAQNENYSVQIQVIDEAGNDLAFPYTGMPNANPSLTFTFATYAPGSNPALQFDGNDYVNLSGVAANFASVGDFTISGWFKIRNKGAQQFLFRITHAESSTRRIQMTEAAGTITADIRATAGGTVYAISTTAFSYDTWTHIAFVRDGAELRLYFDGKLVGSQAAIETEFMANRWAYLGANTYNGSVWGNPDNFFMGAIDKFEIWTTARTAAEIQASMTQPIAPASSLLAGWDFDEAAGDIAYDASGNNYTATIIGAFWGPGPLFEPARPALTAMRNGTQLSLSWDQPNAKLEASEDPAAGWAVLQDATSPYITDMSGPKRFFRLRVD